jgi:hypothetical protein
MQSSAVVAVRALVMLACVVGIPYLAVSGTSWSEIAKKFQNFRLPAILTSIAASNNDSADDSSPAPPNDAGVPPVFSDGPQNNPTGVPTVSPVAAPHSDPVASPKPSTLSANDSASLSSDDIQQRLQHLGATYYLLEKWGNNDQLYRFYCQVAAGRSADYTHYFEAVDADPLQAMLQVLRRVESWRQR